MVHSRFGQPSPQPAPRRLRFIPERVEAMTSVTTGRSKRFETPVGLFTYREIPILAFRFGMTRIELDNGSAFLIASAEKALADKIRAVRGTGIKTLGQMGEYLADDLRIYESALKELNPSHFIRPQSLSRGYGFLAAVSDA